MRHLVSLSGFLLLPLAGCMESTVCTTDIAPAIVLEARDAVNDTPVTTGLQASALLGGQSLDFIPYTFSIEGDTVSLALFAGAGRYEVRLEAQGYQPWTRADILVNTGACGVVARRLTARLAPAVP